MPDTYETLDAVDRLTALAYEFGPFLFAILLLVLVTKRAHDNYAAAIERARTGAVATGEVKTERLILLACWGVALGLILVSVAWWLLVHVPGGKQTVRFAVFQVPADYVIRPRGENEVYQKTDEIGSTVDYWYIAEIPSDDIGRSMVMLNVLPSDGTLGETNLSIDLTKGRNQNYVLKVSDGILTLEKR